MSVKSRKKLALIVSAVGTALLYLSSFFSPAAGNIIKGAGEVVVIAGQKIADNADE